jgi:hypothetical protein
LLCLAPDLDNRYQRIYGFFHDDLRRRNASLGLNAAVSGDAIGARMELPFDWRLVHLLGAAYLPGHQRLNSSRSFSDGTYHFLAAAFQRAPRLFASSFSAKGTTRKKWDSFVLATPPGALVALLDAVKPVPGCAMSPFANASIARPKSAEIAWYGWSNGGNWLMNSQC